VLPLPKAAIEILNSIPRRDGCDLVFGRLSEGFTNWKNAKAKLDARLALSTGWVLHDLRRTLVTRMNDKNLALPHVVEVMVNHSLGSTVHIVNYNHASYRDQKRDGFTAWADYVQALVGANIRHLPQAA
jgi:integrase